MGDETTYGPELHRLGFGDAVEADLLTDYKVLVLAVDEEYVAENFQTAMATSGEIALGDAAKLIGCWNGLAKHYGSAANDEDRPADWHPMKTAVAFAKDIKTSKTAAASFPVLVERALQDETTDNADRNRLRVEAAHVDGTMGIHERNTHLAWLKANTPDDVCRILTNARCLSEGVDVPALDAVLFLTPRGSQVDVVQSVGRVMRKAPGKELGYIILPIVVPSGVAPEEALRDNERYRVVWQVLQALRSHDDRFHAMVNQIELNKRKPDRLDHRQRHPPPRATTRARTARPTSQSDRAARARLRLRRLPRRHVRPHRAEGRGAPLLGDLGQGRLRHRPGPHHPHQGPPRRPRVQPSQGVRGVPRPACAATSTRPSPPTRPSRCSPSTSSPGPSSRPSSPATTSPPPTPSPRRWS